MQESLSAASKTEAIKPSDLNRVIIDTGAAKNVMFPTDARILKRASEILVRARQGSQIKLRQSYGRSASSLIKHHRYVHAKQFKRANPVLEDAQNLSWLRHSRRRPQALRQCRLAQ